MCKVLEGPPNDEAPIRTVFWRDVEPSPYFREEYFCFGHKCNPLRAENDVRVFARDQHTLDLVQYTEITLWSVTFFLVDVSANDKLLLSAFRAAIQGGRVPPCTSK